MKIAVDCRALTVQKTGGGYYTSNLLKSLLKTDSVNEYILCAHKPFLFSGSGSKFKIKHGPGAPGLLWQNFLLPAELARERAGLFHSPLFTLPFRLPCPGIITVFDLTPVIFPGLHRGKVRLSFIPVRHSVKTARKIIAISENTKKDLVDLMGAEEKKISVVYPGVGRDFKPCGPMEIRRVREKYSIGANYILHVGTLEPRKNLEFLIDVFNEMIKTNNDDGAELVLAGAPGWGYAGIFERIAEYGLGNRIIVTGYAEPGDMPALYSGAAVFAYPSLYEGFGLPVAEAMACGAPVAASAVSSIPEVLGGAGALIKGWRVREWAETISLLLRDRAAASGFSETGIIRSRIFSWDECAAKTLEIYNLFGK